MVDPRVAYGTQGVVDHPVPSFAHRDTCDMESLKTITKTTPEIPLNG